MRATLLQLHAGNAVSCHLPFSYESSSPRAWRYDTCWCSDRICVLKALHMADEERFVTHWSRNNFSYALTSSCILFILFSRRVFCMTCPGTLQPLLSVKNLPSPRFPCASLPGKCDGQWLINTHCLYDSELILKLMGLDRGFQGLHSHWIHLLQTEHEV